MLTAMDSQHDDVVGRDSEIDGVGKPREDGASRFVVNARKGERVGRDASDEVVQRLTEFLAEPRTSRLVPPAYFERFAFSFAA